jgi:hypothetical protein
MPKLYVKQAGTWKQVLALYVKTAGVWKSPVNAAIRSSGTNKSFYPDDKTPVAYTTAGTFSYVVPAGIFSITATIVGGGGGGGGDNSSGDTFQGGSGGSGGFYSNQSIAVTPGETLTVTVGAQGLSGWYNFNGGFQCAGTSGSQNGGAGGLSRISRGGTPLFTATGGEGGTGATNNFNAPAGAGGSPGGVAGQNGANTRNGFTAKAGGSNGTGYGTGGSSNGFNPGYTCPTKGGLGYVSITPI